MHKKLVTVLYSIYNIIHETAVQRDAITTIKKLMSKCTAMDVLNDTNNQSF